MIISHKYKFIFLHVPKTAGSSITTFFSQYLGDNDILIGWNHPLRKGIPYNQKILKMVNNKFGLKMISKAINLRIKDRKVFERPIIEYAFREIIKKKMGTNSMHASANHVKKLDKQSWNTYFKFTFVRNPYTHALSDWMFNEKDWSIVGNKKYKEKRILSKAKFLNYLKKFRQNKNSKINKIKVYPHNKIYMINNKIAVDYVGKFENLRRDVKKIQRILKLPKEKFQLDHFKKNSNKSDLKYYTNESKKLVEEIWEKEFEFFNYKFPN